MHHTRICIVLAGLAFSAVQQEAMAHPPSAIAVDERGRVFFTDAQEGVFRIDDDGGGVTRINPSAMHWMAFDRKGAFADAPEEFGEWFGRITPKGERPTLVSCSDFPCAIARDGNLYYAKMHGLTIVRRTPAGDESVLIEPKDYRVDAMRLGINGMASGPDGSIYVVTLDSVNRTEGTGEHVLYAINLDGDIRKIAQGFVREKTPQDEEHPEVRPQYCRGMAVDNDGNVYISVTGSRYVMKVTPQGEGSVIVRAERPWSPTGVDVRDGFVYVLEYDDEKRVQNREWPLRVRKLDRDGKVATLVTIRGE